MEDFSCSSYNDYILQPQGLFEAAAHAKSEAERAMKLYQQFNKAKEVLHYEGSSLEDISQNVVARVEDLLSLIVLLSEVRSVHGLLATVQLYVRTHFTAPMTPLIWSFVKPQIDKLVATAARLGGFEPQAGYEDDIDKTEIIVKSLRSAIKDWKRHREGPFAKAFGGLISTLVAFGAFPGWEENAALASFLKLFKVKTWDVQKDCVNFTDMMLETVTFFLERGYAAYKLQDLSLLFFTDNDALEMEREYSLLVSAQPLLDAGKLEELLAFDEGIRDVTDYEVRLEALIAKVHTAIGMSSKSGASSQLASKLVVLKKLRTALILAQKTSCIRERPFTFMVYGASSVGKSEIMAKLMKILLSANGLPSTKEFVCTLNGDDKFASEYKTYHNGVIIDDFGNTKAEHYDGNPCAQIINFANNMPIAVLKADVESKGVVYFLAKMLGVTTNVKHLMAHLFSNEPVSILRRFDFVLDVRLRPEYVDPETGGLDGTKMHKFIEDAWLINLQTVKIMRDGKKRGVDDYEFKTILKDASFEEVISYLIIASKEHTIRQKRFVANVENAYDVELCQHYRHPDECGACAQLAMLAVPDLVDADSDDENSESEVPDLVAGLDAQGGDEDDEDVPSDISDSINMDTYCQYKPLSQLVSEWYEERKPKVAIEAIKGAAQSFVDIYNEYTNEIVNSIVIGGVAIGAIVLAIKAFKSFSKLQHALSDQSGVTSAEVMPYSMDELDNPWKTIKRTAIPRSSASSTTSTDELSDKIQKNIQRCRVIWPDGRRKICMMFPMRGSSWVLPSHMLPKDDEEYIIENIRPDLRVLDRVIREKISSRDFVRINKDLTLVNLSSGGTIPNLAKFLPSGPPKNGSSIAAFLHEMPKTADITNRYLIKIGNFKEYQTSSTKFDGFDYHLPIETYDGLCGAPVITCSAQLVGFHLAGDGTYGAAGYMDSIEFERAFVTLNRQVLVAHSAGTMQTVQFGKDFTPTADIPAKHSVRFMTEEEGREPSLEIFGAHSLGVPTFRSDVRTSPISEDVAEIMGLEREHGKPDKRKIWKHWQRDLHSIAHTRGDFEPGPFVRAYDDLDARVKQVIAMHPNEMCFKPLSWHHTINGINGVKWIDRINTKSSMGFPINKSKSEFLEPVLEEVLGVAEPVDFNDPEVLQYFLEAEEIYSDGERIYAVHRGNLKDEPTKFTKNKIRVFAGSQVVFTLLVRKYFLPVVKFIQDHGLELECAVGINAFGPIWEDVTQLITQHGADRMIAGDYKAFDKTASAKAMMSGFGVLISIAEAAGYSDRDLTIMAGIATDVCYPLYEFNGVMLQAFGSNPSGHPLTVVVNNLMNSLYLRYAYYSLHPEPEVPMFHTRVAALCYGDDNVMNVAKTETKFNHTAVAAVLAEAGITYTMADKTSESIPLISLDQINFLKRGFRYEPALKRHVAPIEEASISKMLHNIRGDGAPDTEVAMNALYTANREYFLHGREVFDVRHSQLERVGVKNFDPLFSLPSWDALVDEFLEEDVTVYGPHKQEACTLSAQSGEESPSDISAVTSISSQQIVFGCEDEDMLTDYVTMMIDYKPIYRNYRFLGLGEFDLVYGVFKHGHFVCNVNIEVKTLYAGAQGSKISRLRAVIKQAKKYGKILHLVRNQPVVSCVFTERGLEVVKLYGELKGSSRKFVAYDFLGTVGNPDAYYQQLSFL
jgi:hypothetical protein